MHPNLVNDVPSELLKQIFKRSPNSGVPFGTVPGARWPSGGAEGHRVHLTNLTSSSLTYASVVKS